jgi:hypothetical protein
MPITYLLPVLRVLISPNFSACRIGPIIVKEPDCSLKPVDRETRGRPSLTGRGNSPFPTVVVEVAVFHESLPKLIEILDLWTSRYTTVMYAIGIKIYGRRTNGTYRMQVSLFNVQSFSVSSE